MYIMRVHMKLKRVFCYYLCDYCVKIIYYAKHNNYYFGKKIIVKQFKFPN